MKYLILLCDGMADLPVDKLQGKTPMEVANKPMMDYLAQNGYVGMVKTVPTGILPGSDTANMSVMGFDPKKYYTGRSPIEAVSMGINMNTDDVAFRVNLVTLSDDQIYSDKTMIDYSSDEITTQEAKDLIDAVNKEFSNEKINFHSGISYRHCMIWENAPVKGFLVPPHDILTKKIKDYLPKDEYSNILDMMQKSYMILKDHPINLRRIQKGLNPANSIWIWGQGKKPSLPLIKDEYGINGSVIAAVDLIFGLGICSGLKTVKVPGATGNIHTNFSGKANAAINEFENGQDYVYLHIEAPDECGHRNEVEGKVKSIELIDEKVLRPIYDYFQTKKTSGEDYKIMILPDHPTPLSLRTHTDDPVPFIIYDSTSTKKVPTHSYTENNCTSDGTYFDSGPALFSFFIKG